MNQKEMTRRIAKILMDSKIKKKIIMPGYQIHLSDNFGNEQIFKSNTCSIDKKYTVQDVEIIMNTFLWVLSNALKDGEKVVFRGWFSVEPQYRKARKTKHPDTGEELIVDGHYIPKFKFGNWLKDAVTCYGNKKLIHQQDEADMVELEEVSFEEFFMQLTGESIIEFEDEEYGNND